MADAVLCADGPVASLIELSQQSNFRRGHGALYDALARGAVDEERVRSLPASQLPDGPLMFGVDASKYPRPSAECSPGRGHHYAPRCDRRPQDRPGLAVPVDHRPGVRVVFVDAPRRRGPHPTGVLLRGGGRRADSRRRPPPRESGQAPIRRGDL
ncbi:hypothetical protein [Streptomyces sp. NBC_00057]|uniref:hypothetical protein n=1 Tax=Streptomyces sp. NBC_00057 TaxID=2975634 RepID=UPI00386C5CAA